MIGGYHRDMSVQAYFEYDAKKSSGWTLSHLRFSPKTPIDAPFRVEEGQAGYVACHNESYVQANKFDVPKHLKRHGTFFLNTTVASIKDPEERLKALEEIVSPKVLRKLALRNAKFYIMDAGRLAAKFGLAGRINMICMCVFFRLSGVLPLEDAVALLKSAIKKNYSYKGDEVVKKNIDLLDTVVSDPEALVLVEIPSRWRTMSEADRSYSDRHIELISDEKAKKFMEEIGDPVTRLEGDDIPVSTFLANNLLGGVMIPGTTKFEKRNPNPSGQVPLWVSDNCTQCNQCVFVCPHAAIRPFVVTKDEQSGAPHPESFDAIKATGPEFAGKRYRLQVSVLDCTGCNACVEACPEAPKALEMGDIESVLATEKDNWNYAMSLPDRGRAIDKFSVRGSQFQTPLMEFSGACMGCGETPYFKLLTQLFGERMLIANATGCSTIWGGSFPSNPYTVSKETGRGPAWANSLFEDNAEFGLGMFASVKHRRERLISLVQEYVHLVDLVDKDELAPAEKELSPLLHDWLEVRMEKSDKCTFLFDKMKPMLKALAEEGASDNPRTELIRKIWSDRDMFPKISQWITGGDGWAYDIGYGGLDHTAAFADHDVNILVVDTEMYSNTGGQQSKATPAGAAVKFAMGGKVQKKKNLGEIFMSYEHIYVASVALHNQAQTLQAMMEAEQHDGPSIIIAYAPCIQQGVRPQGLNDMFDECKFAVESGYWPLYRYKPSLAEQGQNPFILDSKKLRKDVTAFLQRENRFINLRKRDPKIADTLWENMNKDVQHRMEHLRQLAEGYKAFDHADEAKVLTLFASETGTAARVARDFAAACPHSSTASALDDIDLDDIDGKTIAFFVATCGQGAMPQNGKSFFAELQKRQEPFKEGTQFMMFGLGDSSYFFYVKAAKDIEERMVALGAKSMIPIGLGDDSAEEGMEQGLIEWLDKVWPALELPPPEEVPHITPVDCSFSERAVIRPEDDQRMLEHFFHSDDIHAVSSAVLSNELMCRPDYNRDFRTIRFAKGSALEYNLGDALEIFPHNDPEKVANFLHDYSPDFGEHTVVKLHAWGMNGEISLGALFTYVLDLFGKPSKHFLHELSTFETDEEEKKTMLDATFLKKAAKETGMTVADALLRFKKAQPPLPALLAMIPVIKPRAYSIASAPQCDDNIELLVLIETWWCEAGMRVGLNCDMLRQLKPGDHIWCRVHAGSMEPPSPEQPVVCAGIGSGLAPHMAFLRDHVRAAEEGEKVGDFSLFFGNRYEADEYLYEKEVKEYDAKYPWFHLHAAFSRDDPKKKVYVQDLIGATDDARLFLRENPEGMLYVCGNRNLPKPLQENLVKSFSMHSEDKSEIAEAEAVVEQLYIRGRAQQEVW